MYLVSTQIKYNLAPIRDLDQLPAEIDKYFISFKSIKDLNSIYQTNNAFERAIIIQVNGKLISGIVYYDYIQELFAYYVEALYKAIIHQTTATFYFPDQAIEVIIKRSSLQDLLFTFDQRKYTFSLVYFANAFCEEASYFFHRVNKELHFSYKFEEEFTKIKAIQQVTKYV